MIRLLLVIIYGFRYIYWAVLEFSTAMGKQLKVQGTVESATFEHGPLGLDQVRVRYKYSVNGRSYSGSFIRECSRKNTALLLRRFPVSGAVWIHVDQGRPNRSHLPSGLGYSGALLAIVPMTALALLWAWWVHAAIMRHRGDPTAHPQVVTAECPAGLPGTPESVAGKTERAARKELIRYKSKEGEFSILFPSEPQLHEIESIPTPYGALQLHRASVEAADAYYEASYGDVPGRGPIDNAAWLSSSGNARLQKSTLIERHDIKLNDLPGNTYTAADDQYYWSERIYFAGRRFYRISIYMPRSGCNWPPHAAAILNSFRTTHSSG